MDLYNVSYALCIFFIGFFIGKAYKIGKMVVEEATMEDIKDKTNQSLSIEKANGFYYAYVGKLFVAQARNFDELFENVRQNRQIKKFNVYKEFDNLSNDEKETMFKVIEAKYGKIFVETNINV
jgi:hypothetical protein